MNKIFDYSNNNLRWTNEMLQQEALKYSSRKIFQNTSKGAYLSAYRRGILSNICSHMKPIRKIWSHELVKKEALKYKTRTEFQDNCGSAYMYALSNSILNEICLHMQRSGSISSGEKELFSIISSKYSTCKRFRDRSINIKNKPYIKAFEIDIFVPYLNKGIEFDGKYFHSFENMRRDKSKKRWSDKDIMNYHRIKDRHFLSKGIKILHVKEEDWLKNKDLCIKKCLEFLGS